VDKLITLLQRLVRALQAWHQTNLFSPRWWGPGLAVASLALLLVLWLTAAPRAESPGGPTGPVFEGGTPEADQARFTPLAGVTATPTVALMPIKAGATPEATREFSLHTVAQGESLIAIAARYNITTEALITANDLRDPTALAEGQVLLVPPRAGLRIPIVLHTVAPGDTLLTIASTYGSSVQNILTANPGLETDPLPEGQAVAVPMIFNQPKPVPNDKELAEEINYTVQPGDIPLTIAAQFNVPVEVLLATNGITDPTRLRIGQELIIPAYEGLSLGFPVVLYELELHDTLLTMASMFGSSIKDILAINPDLQPSALQPGDLVAVPIIFAPPRPTPAPQKPTPVPVNASAPFADLQAQMVNAVNAARLAAGLPPYQADAELTAVAEAHATNMVTGGFFSHVAPGGISLHDRYNQAGLTYNRAGENIQRNTRPRDQTVPTALNWFMGSPPHRGNILHPHLNRIGVGIVEGPPGWYTLVLDFAER
jgi:uncharacterized protein YkwD/phage tail protein X